MTPVLFLVTALAGGCGALLRWTIEASWNARSRSPFPWAIMCINVVGSLLLGVLTGWLDVNTPELHVLGAGLLGGFTTFSSVATASALMIEQRNWRSATFNALGTLALTIGAAMIGLWLGHML